MSDKVTVVRIRQWRGSRGINLTARGFVINIVPLYTAWSLVVVTMEGLAGNKLIIISSNFFAVLSVG